MEVNKSILIWSRNGGKMELKRGMGMREKGGRRKHIPNEQDFTVRDHTCNIWCDSLLATEMLENVDTGVKNSKRGHERRCGMERRKGYYTLPRKRGNSCDSWHHQTKVKKVQHWSLNTWPHQLCKGDVPCYVIRREKRGKARLRGRGEGVCSPYQEGQMRFMHSVVGKLSRGGGG